MIDGDARDAPHFYMEYAMSRGSMFGCIQTVVALPTEGPAGVKRLIIDSYHQLVTLIPGSPTRIPD